MSKPSTDPGLGPPSDDDAKPAKKTDTVDDILDGFGTSRTDQPRILPKKSSDITPTPPEVGGRKELTPTEPGSRQKQSRYVVAAFLGFGAVLILGIAFVKLTSGGPENPDTVPTTAAPTDKSTAVMAPTAMLPVPTDTATATVDTAAPVPSASAAPSAKPSATAKATAVAPSAKPSATATGSDQPGLHLIKGQ